MSIISSGSIVAIGITVVIAIVRLLLIVCYGVIAATLKAAWIRRHQGRGPDHVHRLHVVECVAVDTLVIWRLVGFNRHSLVGPIAELALIVHVEVHRGLVC